jgi:hypothetical protein
MNEKQKEWIRLFRLKSEFVVEEPEWGDVVAIHSSAIEKIYEELKKLETKESRCIQCGNTGHDFCNQD